LDEKAILGVKNPRIEEAKARQLDGPTIRRMTDFGNANNHAITAARATYGYGIRYLRDRRKPQLFQT
jgi:hypothetical protein